MRRARSSPQRPTVGAYCHRPPFTPHGHQRAWREGEETTRHAASLRPPGNGRIGFKPPYTPKGNPAPTDGWAWIRAWWPRRDGAVFVATWRAASHPKKRGVLGTATRHATSLQRPAAPDHPTRRGRKRPPCRPIKMACGPRGHRPAGYSPSRRHPGRYLRGVRWPPGRPGPNGSHT